MGLESRALLDHTATRRHSASHLQTENTYEKQQDLTNGIFFHDCEHIL